MWQQVSLTQNISNLEMRVMRLRIGDLLYLCMLTSSLISAGLSAWAIAMQLFLVSNLVLLALLVIRAVQDHVDQKI